MEERRIENIVSQAKPMTTSSIWFLSASAIILTAYVFYNNSYGTPIAMRYRAIVMMLSFWLIFGIYPIKSSNKWLRGFDILLAILGTVPCLYVFFTFDDFILKAGSPNTLDIILGVIFVIMILEATRRSIGLPLCVVALVFILYGLLGNYLPGVLRHRGYPFGRLINQLFLTMDGIWGIPLGVASTFVYLFILFGAFLKKANAEKYITEVAYTLTGQSKGGPAKIAVVSSGLMGTISGSSIANVVGTGSFTIPLMKSVGYKPHFAGAVEACASTGGMLMPPVMGAAAFIMSEMTGIPYIKICIAAAIPAILYYFSIYVNVHLEAEKNNLAGVPADKMPPLTKIFKGGWFLTVPVAILIFYLLMGSSPSKAAYMAIVGLFLISLVKKDTRMGLRDILGAMELGARNSLGVIVACACAGITIGVVLMTGLGLRFSNLVLIFAGQSLFLALLFTAIASLFLGMAVPPSASYVILAILAVPALLNLGIPVLSANMFVFYNGLLADITPPVALCAYAAAGIAKSNPMLTGYTAMRIGIIIFFVPFFFIYWPSLLFQGPLVDIAIAFFTAVLGIIALAAGFQGYFFKKMNIVQRLLMFPAGFLLIVPALLPSLIGLAVGILVLIWHYFEIKKTRRVYAGPI